jgi:predicted  nucleic acid-binding Zn-ribbon protein
MATIEKTTKRQGQHDDALTEAKRLRAERDPVGKRFNELNEKILEMQNGRKTLEAVLKAVQEEAAGDPTKTDDAKRLRLGLARFDEELHETIDLRDGAERKHAELNQTYSAAFMTHQRAVVALQREPCEDALQGLDEALRGVEQAWSIAAQEALKLNHKGDLWGSSLLSKLIAHIAMPSIGPNGPWEIKLPRVELPD